MDFTVALWPQHEDCRAGQGREECAHYNVRMCHDSRSHSLSLSLPLSVHQVNALDSLPSAEIVNCDFQLSFHHFSLLSLSVFVAFAQIKFDLSCLIAFLPVCLHCDLFTWLTWR